MIMGQLTILPKHYWTGKDANGNQRDPLKTTLEPPLGSGPYRTKPVRPAPPLPHAPAAPANGGARPAAWLRPLPHQAGDACAHHHVRARARLLGQGSAGEPRAVE